ncbi:MAG: Ig-like domain-containing protein, partial [Beijerinckiaceae bacterium]|nr:Ig-like domain-containing protein [Beijerinckiaceae bacterium]
DGGAGSDDWVSYAGATEAIGAAIVPSLQPGHWGGAAGDSLVGIENILGSNFDDGITGDSGTNILNGGLGADSLFAEGGDDSLIGGEGNDLLGGSGGSDWAIYADAASGATVDLITGRASGAHGADTLDDIENVLGGIGDDSLLGDGGDNTLVGGSGNDTLIGGAGNDALDGNAGNDWLDFGAGTESVTYALGMGNDTLDGGAGTDFLKLSAGTWTSGTDGAWTTLIQGSTRLYVRNWENIGAANIALTPLAEDTPVTLTTAGLLAGWSGGNGTTLSVLNLTASSGTLTNLGNGSWGFQGATNDDTSVTFSYQVSDGTVAIAATATLDLTPVNDAPVITSGTTASFAENGTGIAYQAVVSDPEGATLTWSLGGADADLFNISSSGAVTFKTAPNFEAPGDAGTNNLYDITVTASDGALSTSRNVAITVTNVNDVAPSITSGTTASFAENGTGTVYQAAGSDPEGATLTWSLGGTDAALFNISSSGAVTFKTAPNFEAPGDVGSNNVYDIIVTASDGALTASRNVAITVTDVNDVAPSISSGSTANFAENGTGIAYQAVGADPDAGTVLSWTLGGTDADLFNISSSGAVTFKAAPDFEAPADAGGNNVYDITVTASDGALSSLARAVTIAVTDVREIATLTGFAPSVTFAENTVNATPQLIDSNVVFTAGDSLAGGRLVVAGLLAED